MHFRDTTLRYRSGDMLLAPRKDPEARHQRRHNYHHGYGDGRRITQPAAVPLAPDISGKHLTFRRRQDNRHGQFPISREGSPNPHVDNAGADQRQNHFPKDAKRGDAADLRSFLQLAVHLNHAVVQAPGAETDPTNNVHRPTPKRSPAAVTQRQAEDKGPEAPNPESTNVPVPSAGTDTIFPR